MEYAKHDESVPDDDQLYNLSTSALWHAVLFEVNSRNHAPILQRADFFLHVEFPSLKYLKRYRNLLENTKRLQDRNQEQGQDLPRGIREKFVEFFLQNAYCVMNKNIWKKAKNKNKTIHKKNWCLVTNYELIKSA